MSFGTYEIELPINKELPYQQLYRGRNYKDEVCVLSLFPKQSLTQELRDQIMDRSKQYNYVQEVSEDENLIIIAYLNSTLWISLQQKYNGDFMKSLYPKLYDSFSKLKGYLDFDEELVFIQENQVFILDYGLKQHFNKRHKDLEYTTKTKSYLFGLMLFNMINDKDMSEKLLKCNEQYQIDQIIHSFAEQHRVSNELYEYFGQMLQIDPNLRPTFEEVGQWRLFKTKKELQTVHQSVMDFSNKIIGIQQTPNKQNQTQRSARPQSQEFKEPHYQQVKAAMQRQRKLITSQTKICTSSYAFATSQIHNKMRGLKQQGKFIGGGQTMGQFFNTESKFTGDPYSNTYTSQGYTYQQTQQTYPGTQNDFFSNQQKQYTQRSQPYNNISATIEQQQQQQQQKERRTPFLFDGTNPVPVVLNQPPQLSTKTEKNNQEYNIQNNIKEQRIQQNQDQNLQSNFFKPQSPKIQQTKLEQHIQQQDQKSSTSNEVKFKTPIVASNNQNDNNDQLESIQLSQTAQFGKTEIPTVNQKKQEEIFKKPQIEKTLYQQQSKGSQNLTLTLQKSQSQNQNIEDIEEPTIIRPNLSIPSNRSNNQLQSPKVNSIPASPSNMYNEYVQKYFSYLSIIQIITYAVSDANEKLSATQQIWIVPLSIVFKRAYQLRMEVQEDIEKQRNGFGVKDFMGFKNSKQYQSLSDTIKEQNQVMKQEFEKMLEIAKKKINRLDDNVKQKMTVLLNLDISKDMRDQAEQYLFTQIYPRIVQSIKKLRTNTLADQRFSELDWLQARLKSLYAILVMELPSYEIESDLFQENVYLQYLKNNDIQQVEEHCQRIENSIKSLKKFNK